MVGSPPVLDALGIITAVSNVGDPDGVQFSGVVHEVGEINEFPFQVFVVLSVAFAKLNFTSSKLEVNTLPIHIGQLNPIFCSIVI